MSSTLENETAQNRHICRKALFLKWLREWQVEAQKKGVKTQYSYAKAIRSLTKYPLAILSGNECKLLEGFGRTICSMLDERLAAHSDQSDSDDAELELSFQRKVHKRAKRPSTEPKRTPKSNQYIPHKNSGSYALILTLYKDGTGSGGRMGMTKKQLMEAAQPLAEQSFTIPPPGSYYTAWSSMGTLIKKGLVAKFSQPAKYVITDTGTVLAQKLVAADSGESSSSFKPSCSQTMTCSDRIQPDCEGLRPEKVAAKKKVRRQPSSSAMSSGVIRNDKTSVSTSDFGSTQNTSYTYVPNKIHSWRATGNYNNEETSVARFTPEAVPRNVKQLAATKSSSSVPHRSKVSRATSVGASVPSCSKVSTATSVEASVPSCSKVSSVISVEAGSSYKWPLSDDGVCNDFTAVKKPLEKPDFKLEPGSFRVILCVDNQEYFASGSHNRELLIKALDQKGVRYEVRKLQIGDFLWIAQYDDPGSGEKVELVLNYILERKRMDDLASSIVDGRFKEQKFRLRNCGISNAIYLVEEYGSGQHFSISEDALNQSIVNTQVIDGFFVKRTRNTSDSADYLTLMTRYLQSVYSNKTLLGYKRQLTANDTNGSIKSPEAIVMSFKEFNAASIKTRPVTVTEMFAKHLMQLHGVTAEKAAAILQRYPTPASLIAAYDECSDDKARCDSLLANLKFGPTQRNIGLPLGKAASALYCTGGRLG